MAANRDRPDRWNSDRDQSVDCYNNWFLQFAPEAYRATRIGATKDVEETLAATGNLTRIQPDVLRENPSALPALRMSTCPPLAVDRLIGLSGANPNVVRCMEGCRLPTRLSRAQLDAELIKIASVIEKMADPDIFVWLGRREPPTEPEIVRAATIVADRLCGSIANPIVRNAQERRQLSVIKTWLEARGYREVPTGERTTFDRMPQGTFSFRVNVSVVLENGVRKANIPIDAVVMPKSAHPRRLPLLIEAKSAGDFTNVNKRRKEEGLKMAQLKRTYGQDVDFVLFLCGYFDSGYLGYEAAEGIDWVWEHRMDDLAELGL